MIEFMTIPMLMFGAMLLAVIVYQLAPMLANWYGGYLVKKENKECEDSERN